MADIARPWIKLWKSWRTDPDIIRLSWEQRGKWVALLLFVADNGCDGTWTGPLQDLAIALGLSGRGTRPRLAAVTLCRRLPGITVTAVSPSRERVSGDTQVTASLLCGSSEDTGGRVGEQPNKPRDTETVTVTFTNWRKYQESSSTARTRRWRHRRSGDAFDRHGNAGEASRERVTVTADVTKKRVEKEPPVTGTLSAHVTSNGQPDLDSNGFERSAFRRDCPDPTWRGRCVIPDHPGPKPIVHQCPYHAAERTHQKVVSTL